MSKQHGFKICTIAAVLLFVGGCYKANSQPQSSTVKDRDGNIYTVKILPGNKIWMTENLNINIPGSYCYDNDAANCKRYGRLYTWNAAQQACMILGNGWYLPGNEEWQQMAKWFGGVNGDSEDSGHAAYKALLPGGKSALNILLGGGRDPNGDRYARLEAHGFYWTATATDSASAWMYNFGKGVGMLNHHNDIEKSRAVSVRCIRDAGNVKE